MQVILWDSDIHRQDFNGEGYAVLFTVPEASIYDVLKHDGKFYIVCSINHQKQYAGVHEVDFKPEGEEYTYEPQLKCPYCGHEDSDSWEISDDSGTIECGSCGNEFDYERIVTVDYSSFPKAKAEVKEIEHSEVIESS